MPSKITIENPINWAYRQHYYGRQINLVVYAKKVSQYMTQEHLKTLEDICRVTKHIAVSSHYLTRHQRHVYSSQRTSIGIATFYLFPADQVPLEIYIKLEPEDDVYIYMQEEHAI